MDPLPLRDEQGANKTLVALLFEFCEHLGRRSDMSYNDRRCRLAHGAMQLLVFDWFLSVIEPNYVADDTLSNDYHSALVTTSSYRQHVQGLGRARASETQV